MEAAASHQEETVHGDGGNDTIYSTATATTTAMREMI